MKIGAFGAVEVLLVACSGGDPGAVNVVPREHSGPHGQVTASDDSGVAAPSVTAGDAGTATADGGPNLTDPFRGSTYASTPVATSAKQHHVGKAGAPANPGKNDECLSCHNGGGGPKFGFAATVFTDTAGTTPAVNYEVIVVDSTGAIFKASTDADGNVWQPDVPVFKPPGFVGVRNGTKTAKMSGSITNGSCNAGLCHAGPQGAIHVP